VIGIGAVTGLVVWLSAVIPVGSTSRLLGFDVESPSPFVLGNVVALSLILLLADGRWRRVAVSITAVVAVWLTLYSTLLFTRWRSSAGWTSGIDASSFDEVEQRYRARKLSAIARDVPSQYRALRISELERKWAKEERERERRAIEHTAKVARKGRAFFLSTCAALLCATGAAKVLRRHGPYA
jgi:hypothetical protein